jgi:hypothetical protein
MGDLIKDNLGRFVKGTVPNPNGRPKGSKNRITKAKQDLEVLMREKVIKKKDIQAVWESLVNAAKDGNVHAAKIVLDKTLSTIRNEEEEGGQENRIVIKIDNLTMSDHAQKTVSGTIIDEGQNG